MKKLMILLFATGLTTITVWSAGRVPDATPAGIAVSREIAATRDVDQRAWTELDIIPMPKNIRLTDKDLVLDPDQVALVIGADACQQSEIGADWINRRLAQVGGKTPLPVINGTEIPADKTAIIIGTSADNPLIAQAVAEKIVNVGEKNPGERGYEIRRTADGKKIFLAGADNIGALYACVTFGELLEMRGAADGNAIWRAVEVRDWPDFLEVRLGAEHTGGQAIPELKTIQPTGIVDEADRVAYLESLKKIHERLMRWKVSEFEYILAWKHVQGNMPPETMATFREGIEHGLERGIAATANYDCPYVGSLEHTNRHPEVPAVYVDERFKLFDSWAPQWDDTRRETAREVASYYRDMGLAEIKFHDTDAGSYENPALWNKRCEYTRRRWGDDYAAATAHKFRIYYDEIRAVCPEIKIHFTEYPYTLMILDQRARAHEKQRNNRDLEESGIYSETIAFWRGLAEKLPSDVTLAIREAYPTQIQAFRDIWPYGVFTWYSVGSRAWESFFNETPSYLRDYFKDGRDKLYPVIWHPERFVPFLGLAVREYSWNVNAPGACSPEFNVSTYLNQSVYALPSLAGDRRQRHEIYTLLLPRICRNLFGKTAGPEIAAALTLNIAPNQVFDRFSYSGQRSILSDYGRMSEQADWADKAAEHFDRVWNRMKRDGTRLGMDDYAFRRFVYLREVFQATRWAARIKALDMLANDNIRMGDLAGARIALAAADSALANSAKAFNGLLRERPPDPLLAATGHRWMDMWRTYMVDHEVVTNALARIKEQLGETRGMLEQAGPVHRNVLLELLKNRQVDVAHGSGEIVLDGKLTETEWNRARPLETLILAGRLQAARAFTRGRLLHNKDALYIGTESWMMEGGADRVLSGELLEWWLKTPGTNGAVFCLTANSAGTISLTRRDMNGTTTKLDAGNYTATLTNTQGCWTMETRIPWDTLDVKCGGGNGWRAGLKRVAARPDKGVETSWSGERPTEFADGDISWLHPVVWVETPEYRPQVSLELLRFSLKTRTLPDRIAAVVDFSIDVETDTVLNNACLTAELYDVEGELQARETLWEIKRVYYACRPYYEVYGLAFREDTRDGELRLCLESDEGVFEERIRIVDGIPVSGLAVGPTLHVHGANAKHVCAGANGAYEQRADSDRGLYYLNKETGFVIYPEDERWVVSERLDGKLWFEHSGRIEGRYTNILGSGNVEARRSCDNVGGCE